METSEIILYAVLGLVWIVVPIWRTRLVNKLRKSYTASIETCDNLIELYSISDDPDDEKMIEYFNYKKKIYELKLANLH